MPAEKDSDEPEKRVSTSVNRQKVTGNAFRTLGLGGSATQRAIDAAARRMRIWPDPARIPATPWDIPELGPIARGRVEIEQAAARLQQPASRLEERLLWFHGDVPPGETIPARQAGDGEASEQRAADARIGSRHNRAIAALHKALASERGVDTRLEWLRVFEHFDALPGDDGQGAAWLGREEDAGDFEKRATSAEISAALRALPGELAAGLEERAAAALLQNKWEAGEALACLLRARADKAGSRETYDRLMDRLEDELATRCEQVDAQLRPALRTNHDNPSPFFADNLEATRQADELLGTMVRPLVRIARELSRQEPERHLRMGYRAGKLLILVALGWEWSNQMMTAEQTLKESLELLRGTQGEAETVAALERVIPLAARQRGEAVERRSGSIRRETAAANRGQAAVRAPAEHQPRRTAKVSGWQSAWILILVGFGAVRVLGLFMQEATPVEAPPALPAAPSMSSIPLLQTTSDPFAGLREQLPPATSAPAPQLSRFGEVNREE
jgi:hypothetical protein